MQKKDKEGNLTTKEQTYHLDVPFNPRIEVGEKAKIGLG